MNREELEKMFDEEFGKLYSEQHLENAKLWVGMTPYPRNEELKAYLFETIIEEVLKSVIPNKTEIFWQYEEDYNICIDDIKQKAKSLYWIIL